MQSVGEQCQLESGRRHVEALSTEPRLASCEVEASATPWPKQSEGQAVTESRRCADVHSWNDVAYVLSKARSQESTTDMQQTRACWVQLSKPDGLGYIDTADSDLMHHQFRLSLLQWNPGPARRNPTNIVSAAYGKFHAVLLQEASDHVPHIPDQFRVYTDNMDLAILLNKDTFEPDPMVLAFKADSTSKNTWGMVLLIVRGLLRRTSLSGTPTVTFCSVHIHNVVPKNVMHPLSYFRGSMGT